MRFSPIIDITLPLHSALPVWPGDPLPVIEQTHQQANGQLYNSTRWNCSLHWGTHIDAPYHLVENGWRIDQIPLDILLGRVQVVDVQEAPVITPAVLEKCRLKPLPRIIFKTRNSAFWGENPLRFHTDFTALSAEAAEILIQLGVKLVGIDYLSLDLFAAKDLPVHQILYRKNVIGVEGLDLRDVAPGYYHLICLPLRVANADGAPARVLLINENG